MISEFIEQKLKKAKYKIFKDKTYFGEIPGLSEVWSNATALEDCREELKEVLEDWLLLKLQSKEEIPGFRIRVVPRRQLVKNA